MALVAASDRANVPSPAAVANSFAPAALASTGSPQAGKPSASTALPGMSGMLAELMDSETAQAMDSPGRSQAGQMGSGADAVGVMDEAGDEAGGDELFDEDLSDLEDQPRERLPTIEDMLENGDEPLEERLPTLIDWIHPVLGSSEEFPLRSTRRFGAARENVKRKECGQGHCGVDLDGPRGTPIVAVAWGQVVRIEQRSNRRSGKYVRIEHPDYVYTSYMHLDSIASALEVGDEVQPGQVLGTLGRTGIWRGMPHLHFSLEVPMSGELMHIDPTPYLTSATRISEPGPSRGE